MSETVIKVENLSKQYRLGMVGAGTIRDDMKRWWASMRGKEDPFLNVGDVNKRDLKGEGDYVWALKDINFDVNKGEVLGIIGKNGAGKSTLLKILSKVTSPTTGRIKVKGRIASLLEVGTGFHPELSGRDNIYQNGAILGMSKKEIKLKFDEIVDFSGVAKYIDTPVKRYSSGMYVRLAFAVAAHLEPEILIIDEVLAVGDAEFQKKCLGKMKDVAVQGRTVLFVSHNMAAVSNLCTSAMVLKDGMIRFSKGSVSSAIELYLGDSMQKAKVKLADRVDRQGQGNIRMTDMEVVDSKNSVINFAISGQNIKFLIGYNSRDIGLKNISVGLSITRSDGFLITVLSNEISSSVFETINESGFFCCELNKLPLTSGVYLINLIVRQNNIIEDWIQDAAYLTVEDGDFYNTGKVVPVTHRSVLLEQNWTLETK